MIALHYKKTGFFICIIFFTRYTIWYTIWSIRYTIDLLYYTILYYKVYYMVYMVYWNTLINLSYDFKGFY